jgi:hypothetical protein
MNIIAKVRLCLCFGCLCNIHYAFFGLFLHVIMAHSLFFQVISGVKDLLSWPKHIQRSQKNLDTIMTIFNQRYIYVIPFETMLIKEFYFYSYECKETQIKNSFQLILFHFNLRCLKMNNYYIRNNQSYKGISKGFL